MSTVSIDYSEYKELLDLKEQYEKKVEELPLLIKSSNQYSHASIFEPYREYTLKGRDEAIQVIVDDINGLQKELDFCRGELNAYRSLMNNLSNSFWKRLSFCLFNKVKLENAKFVI